MRKLAFLFCAALAFAQDRKVAITIDDLPRGGDGRGRDVASIRSMTVKLLAPFQEQKIPVIGFVNESKLPPKELREILDLWLDAGADLGNHTWSHPNFFTTPLDQFEQNVIRGETVTRVALEAHGKQLRYFRHPFLNTGPNLETRRAFEKFLADQGYQIAPITFDVADYEYALLYTDPKLRPQVEREYIPYLESVIKFFDQRTVEVTGRQIAQTMLLHANQLNADKMPQILAMFRRLNYRFISLEEALKDDAYQLPDEYTGQGGFSWIHRWSITKKMPNKGEPDPADWVQKAYASHH